MDTVLAGLGLGVAVAAGFGPLSVLALTSGLRSGFAPAFGVAVAVACVDGFYALLAGFGIAALVNGDGLQVVGGVALIVSGVGMVRLSGGEAMAVRTFGRGFGVALGLTLANPLTIVSWAAAFTAVVPELDVSDAEIHTLLPLGVFCGTLLWFTGLALGSSYAGRYLGERTLHVVSIVAGVLIAAFGVVFVARGVSFL
jgi:threonine/homoserine/homoserine lactone efflux protein